MSTMAMSDAMIMPATNMTTEVQFAKCDCCGLTEECTPTYINNIRERYNGNWICGLCGEAIKDEMARSKVLISIKEAMTRHMDFCSESRSPEPPRNPTVHLIAAMRQILRRSLDSPIKSLPNSPIRNTNNNVRLSRSYTDLQQLME
uniref:uncharacterized protein LOC122608421 n=1 Tax=Erigeron canadensis TaxID=72917 RepID=UPI001CB971A1|nr:uncharacterized protein LOC122608421 [Erigeron canadensis]XP_043637463.1 uncharacterized protein LOC122608421 [Erigeron canadensis]